MTDQPMERNQGNRVIDHMNEDHADTLLEYVHAFSDLEAPQSATLIAIYQERILLDVKVAGESQELLIDLPEPALDLSSARHALVHLAHLARKKLAEKQGSSAE
ncbi:DUF2470 domain-containing protein [Pokkaliibacter sp. CJK22405]|uniref:DUF2470 domain-containing protein n=1 Tax=Pokkaliibacter sp. CJK22405 TaxID=3384615 RepID=UPI0039847028